MLGPRVWRLAGSVPGRPCVKGEADRWFVGAGKNQPSTAAEGLKQIVWVKLYPWLPLYFGNLLGGAVAS